jgi:hypothetical protein
VSADGTCHASVVLVLDNVKRLSVNCKDPVKGVDLLQSVNRHHFVEC